jgi:hypothetical protein
MGKFAKDDARYRVLSKIPRNQDGVVKFRKRQGHENKFIIAVMDLGEGPMTVLYKLRMLAGETHLSFDHAKIPLA